MSLYLSARIQQFFTSEIFTIFDHVQNFDTYNGRNDSNALAFAYVNET